MSGMGYGPPPTDRPPAPASPAQPRDALAGALGNATMLGIGYAMLRRGGLTVLALLGTAVVVVLVATTTGALWTEILALVWWVAMIVHGWAVGRAAEPRGVRPSQRAVAGLLAVAVVAAVVLGAISLRSAAADVTGRVKQAYAQGDCGRMQAERDALSLGQRIARPDAGSTADRLLKPCGQALRAQRELAAAISAKRSTPDRAGIGDGYSRLDGLMTADADNAPIVRRVQHGFTAKLPLKKACSTVEVTDWIAQMSEQNAVFAPTKRTGRKLGPAAEVQCGDDLSSDQSWDKAKDRYNQVLKEAPQDASLTRRAHAGLAKVIPAAELDTVSSALSDQTYCNNPEKYSKAPGYHAGVNRTYFTGGDENRVEKLPSSWKANAPAQASLIACVGSDSSGSTVRSCTYTMGKVDFHRIDVPVDVYELRTGRKVKHLTLHIDGDSCPQTLSYDPMEGPPSSENVDPSASDIRSAFRPAVTK